MRRPAHDLTHPGWVILCATAVLVTLGLASIYVTDTHYARGHDGPANAAKQLIHVVVAVMLSGAVLHIGYHRIARFAYTLFALSVIGLVPMLIADLAHSTLGGLTPHRNGAYRWIQLPGVQMQPSEFLKLAFVLALAWYLRYRKNYRRFAGLLLPFAVTAIPMTLILLEPDLGTVLLLVPVLMSMLFMAGARIRHLLILLMLGICCMPFAWGRIQGYQRARITAVLLQSPSLRKAVIDHPEAYASLATRRQAIEWAASSGYQLVHSKNAVGSGGLFGYGWGAGFYVKHPLLPDRHNDFIFSMVCHQWGFVGGLTLLLCHLVIVLAGVRIAAGSTEPVGRLLVVGLLTLLGTQVVINVGMALGLMPTTGMTLPLVSDGGSSLLTSFLALALMVSVSQHRPYLLSVRPFEYVHDDIPAGHPADHAGAAGVTDPIAVPPG